MTTYAIKQAIGFGIMVANLTATIMIIMTY